ncbi:MAG: dihydrolipoyl dehydrogenase [Lentisphaerae bacterium]|jgi:dihydrolipoamide dehydrogenase|nr:dihydrolipoyl dehydrogenase [Lentisphaerota bacterium]MBT4819738.1 dihydrolipoyl dehydrogenase [Lentisphaerota bacterium]MBT5606624.1 dihydrolipoyl dehydrogenase [Lentisphaerota bacterium]MBT7059533.1 dihydrolipoyl dehydrogenase [Lentisphaerota bacterium]MBT7843030.1 dihydrolipoyl dehydrogenase [Lentisphaerota bacterium]
MGNAYDVVVIGAGPGGYVAAIRASQLGGRVAVVEREVLGGTCLNWGCIPTKTLIAGTDVLHQVRNAAAFGISVSGDVSFDWAAMLKRKDKTVKGLRQGIGGLLKSNGVDVYEGTAAFVDRHTLAVTKADGSSEALETKNTIIASGSDSAKPGFIPEAENILYSRAALALDDLPESLIILGGGVIGCEFACLFAALGVEVTVVEMLPSILPPVDKDVSRVVAKAMSGMGITILTDSKMSDIASDDESVSCTVGDEELVADAMLVSVGRRPVTDGLQLHGIGLTVDEYGCLPVNERCRTKVPGIYAIGDVTGAVQLAHRASAMGICAANNAMGSPDKHSDALVPGCIFTSPEIGAVGVTEAEAKEQGLDVKVGKFPFAALGKAQAVQETDGFCKIIADAQTDQILGVHVVGPHATDLVAEAATAMNLEITAAELGRAIHAHPTLAESLMEAAHAVHGQCIHMPKSRRRK